MAYNVCIFDLDGTLTDPFEGLVKGIEYAMKKHNLGNELENPGKFIGPPLHDSFKKAFELTDEKTDEVVATFREYYGEMGLYENAVYLGIIQLIQTLKDKKIKLAVATSKPDKFAKLVLKHFDISKYFDYIIGDEMDGSLSRGGKEKLVRAALETLDPKREKTAVMIGDRHHDILGAKAVGIDSIGVLWGYGSREEFETAGATYVVKDTNELHNVLVGK